MKYLPFLFLIAITLLPDVTLAADGLVTCDGPDCNFCSFTEMVSGIIQWIIAIATLIAVLLMVVAGFQLVTSGGDPGAVQKAKSMIMSVVIGFIIMLAAYTIVDTILKALMSDQDSIGRIWDPVDCGNMFEPNDTFIQGYESHDDIRDQNLIDNPILLDTFTGPFNSSEQQIFSANCAREGNAPVYREGPPRVIECRTN